MKAAFFMWFETANDLDKSNTEVSHIYGQSLPVKDPVQIRTEYRF